ncbi:MAG TPA: hypothetical protein VFE98_03030 [Candidatus Bathyarchaeia archaeon]|nr:hypothetical protein [Candidatus Bathyarchaeia archaeon]
MPKKRSPTTETIRREIINTLHEAIRTAAMLAKGPTKRKGPTNPNEPEYEANQRTSWYSVLAYLAQTLNGLMKNVDNNVAKRQLAELRHMVEELRDGDAQPQARD